MNVQDASQQSQRAEWISGRVATLLHHFPRSAQSAEIEDMALVDWVRALSGHSERAISHAVDDYIRTGVFRPKPADILARVEAFEQATARRAIQGGEAAFTAGEAEVIDWAVKTIRLHLSAARDAVQRARSMVFPSWMPEGEVQRAVYAVRLHPEYNRPDDQPQKQAKRFGGNS